MYVVVVVMQYGTVQNTLYGLLSIIYYLDYQYKYVVVVAAICACGKSGAEGVVDMMVSKKQISFSFILSLTNVQFVLSGVPLFQHSSLVRRIF